jgi:hypothetical protein
MDMDMPSELERSPVLQETIAFIDCFLSRPEGLVALFVFPSLLQSLKAISVSILCFEAHNLIALTLLLSRVQISPIQIWNIPAGGVSVQT